jgi:hypothetical protein
MCFAKETAYVGRKGKGFERQQSSSSKWSEAEGQPEPLPNDRL